DDAAEVVAERLGANQEPPIRSVSAPQTGLVLARRPRGEEGAPRLHQRPEVVGVEGGLPAPAAGLVLGEARVVLPSLAEKIDGAVRETAPGEHRDRVDDPSEMRVYCCCCGDVAFETPSTGMRLDARQGRWRSRMVRAVGDHAVTRSPSRPMCLHATPSRQDPPRTRRGDPCLRVW